MGGAGGEGGGSEGGGKGGGEGGGGEGGGDGLVAAAKSNWKSMHMARQSRMLTWKGWQHCAAASRRYVCSTHRGALLRP